MINCRQAQKQCPERRSYTVGQKGEIQKLMWARTLKKGSKPENLECTENTNLRKIQGIQKKRGQVYGRRGSEGAGGSGNMEEIGQI